MENQKSIILSVYNKHPRDENIIFQEEGHIYTILTDKESKYTSVTTWNHTHFPKFNADKVITNMMKGKNWNESNKYWGMTSEQIKELWKNNGSSVSSLGTDLHYEIECFMNNDKLNKGYYHKDLLEYYQKNFELKDKYFILEWLYFIKYIVDFPNLKPYRTEWLIYDEELKLSGSIDMVYENVDGTLSIYDWKRCKNITKINTFNKFAITEIISNLPDSNFWHYTLQLNTYKAILEKKYNKIVTDLYLVCLHPNNTEISYELLKVPILKNEIAELFELRKKELNV